MPKLNSLYYYIDSQLTPEQEISYFLGNRIEKKINQYGNAYLMIHLPVHDEISTPATLQIKEHHISIFQYYEEKKLQSSFHYTLQFSEGTRAHIYFNQAAMQLGDAALSAGAPDELSASILPLIQYATKAIALPLINQVCEKHQTCITALNAHYESTRSALMSALYEHPTALGENKIQLNNTLALLEQLSTLDEKKHRKALFLLKSYRRGLMHAETQRIKDQIETTPATETILIEEVPITISSCSGAIEPPITHQIAIKTHSMQEIFMSAFEQVTELLNNCGLKTETLKERAESHFTCYQATQSLFIRAEKLINSSEFVDQNMDALEKATLCVESYLRKSEDYCLQTLQNALVRGDEESALILKSFTPLLNQKFLALVINTDNDLALKFILTHGNLPIDNRTVSVKEIPQPLLCASFYHKKIKCFNMLLQCKASGLVLGQDNLPIAHTILQLSLDDTFRTAFLTKTPEANNAQFYTQLIAAISIKLNELSLSSAEKTHLLTAQLQYKNAQGLFVGATESRQAQGIMQAALPLAQHLSKDMLEEWKNMPATKEKLSTLSISSRKLMKELREQKLNYMALRLTKEWFSKFSAFQDNTDVISLLGGLNIEQMNEQLECYHTINLKAIRILEINKTLKGTAATMHKKKSRGKGQFAKLEIERRVLQQEIDQLMPHFTDSSNQEKMHDLFQKANVGLKVMHQLNSLMSEVGQLEDATPESRLAITTPIMENIMSLIQSIDPRFQIPERATTAIANRSRFFSAEEKTNEPSLATECFIPDI